MLRIILIALLFIHGLIHLMGFAKAFRFAEIKALKSEITKFAGVLWLLSAILFLSAAFLFIGKYPLWWLAAGIAIILSQILIIQNWRDARAGTILNTILIIVLIPAISTWLFSKKYQSDVSTAMQLNPMNRELIRPDDLQGLPPAVREYLKISGVVNSRKCSRFHVSMHGQLRGSEEAEWINFKADQYSFLDEPERLFWLQAKMKNLPVSGYHQFKKGHAVMDIRLFSLIKVQYQDGPLMDTSETVTYLNDLCLLAPSGLLDSRISWEETDKYKVKATFNNNGIIVSALLVFNEKYELIDFISEDRYYTSKDNTLQKGTWSTPVREYREKDGYKYPHIADAVWKFPRHDFQYGIFIIDDIDLHPE